MWSLLRKKAPECSRFREALENAVHISALPSNLRDHLAACVDCRAASEDLSKSRAVLQALPARRYEPSPWFAARVMSVIAAREAELQQSLETWTVVPRLAARMTWISALALVLVGTWLYEQPISAPRQTGTTIGESLFESTPAPAQDDLLASATEQK